MTKVKVILTLLASLIIGELTAQTAKEGGMIEVDTTLFRIYQHFSTDSYSQATRYYSTPVFTKRQGLPFATFEQLKSPLSAQVSSLEQPFNENKIALHTALQGYRAAVSGSHAQAMQGGWATNSSLWACTGRDAFVEGVFTNSVSARSSLSHFIDLGHFLSLDASIYYSMRGLQSSATQEAFTLTNSQYYNPSWGFYNGQVRNAKVRRIFSPTLDANYQRPLANYSLLSLKGSAQFSRRANSSLGWYNATTPTPNYYTKMPSYLSDDQVKDFINEQWLSNNTDYTQIAWDELVAKNNLSSDGEAYYALEDAVEQQWSLQSSAKITSRNYERMTINYGIESMWSYSRNFKVMRDLLGAEQHTDYDIFYGDDYSKTLPMQNNLLCPDNQIVEGDRFGYDYAISQFNIWAVLAMQYRASRFDIDLDAKIGSEQIYRQGFYLKERFALSSMGRSTAIWAAPYTLRSQVGFRPISSSYLSLQLAISQLPLDSENLFIDAQSSNLTTTTTSGERVYSASLTFDKRWSIGSLSSNVFAHRSRGGAYNFSMYDDLSSTMCRALVSQVGYSCYGVELVAMLRASSDLNINSTLSVGRYLYDTDPYITLLDDYDMSQISEATTSQMSALSLGNTPQAVATFSAIYFGINKYILTLSGSYSALRYSTPSVVRRSERLLQQAFLTSESREQALEQELLQDIYDIELSVQRTFYIGTTGALSLRIKVSNLLGQSSRIIYSRESNRVSLQNIDDYFSGSTLHPSSYISGAPRTFNFSVSYKFY